MIEQISTHNGACIIYFDKILGQGVDGIVYSSIFNSNKNPTVIDVKTATKIIKKDIISDIYNFVKIHKLSSNNFGPCIYDIIIKDECVYIVMELMDYSLGDFIIKSYKETKSWSSIKKEIRNIILPIHSKMKICKITVGDKNVDNYMFKSGVLKKIDFTMGTVKEKLNCGDMKAYDYICAINPFSDKMERIYLT
jgi:hypothetical protein